MTGNKLPFGEEFASGPSGSEEVAAPHLASDAICENEEVWTLAPVETVGASAVSRALTAEEKWPGEWHAIAWMYAHGTSQNQIAKELDYSVSRVSVILNKPQVHEKIEAIRREFLGTESLTKKFASVAPKAADYLASVIRGKEDAKVSERMDASKWMLEKVTGKPKQEGAADSGTTILQLLQALDAVKAAGASAEGRAVSETTDIELTKPKARDPLADWVAENVPVLKSEKG